MQIFGFQYLYTKTFLNLKENGDKKIILIARNS